MKRKHELRMMKYELRNGLFALALAAAMATGAVAGAADEAKPEVKPAAGNTAQPTLDDLLEIGTKPAGTTPAPAGTAAEKPGSPELDAQARKALEKEEKDAADAFRKAVSEMYQVAERIGKEADTSRDVQRDQEEIVKKLDQVIEAAEKCECKGSGSPKSGPPKEKKQNGSQKNQQAKKPGQPQQQQQQASSAGNSPGKAGGVTGGAGITTPLAELRERWGSLPGRVREQLMQGVQEKVSPVYREWTEQYYKRLAEEQP
jgi:hypothetical protein